jgi:hypothetical protein
VRPTYEGGTTNYIKITSDEKTNSMKSIFVLLTSLFIAGTSAFAQDRSTVATAQSKTELSASKSSGKYLITLPDGMTSEEVAENSKFYTRIFTISFDEKTDVATITMIENSDKSRHVIVRFLTSCGVQSVLVEGREMMLEDFFTNYML